MTWTAEARSRRRRVGQRWVSNGTTLSPAVLTVLFLRRHGWSIDTIAAAIGRSRGTVFKQLDTAKRVLGVDKRQLDIVLLRGGELRRAGE